MFEGGRWQWVIWHISSSSGPRPKITPDTYRTQINF